jgi:hypothetical protein
MNDNNSTNNKLKHALFERIEQEHVCPRSRMFFRGRECFIWLLWLITVIVGALAVAVSAFVVTHHQYAVYQATHENLFTFVVAVLPYVWLVVFGVMSFLAVYNLRHTKRGYRYSIVTVLASSIVVSFAAGSALHLFGLGYVVDSYLGNQMGMYMSQDKVEMKLWQQPDEGRLVGMQVLQTVSSSSLIIFQDISGKRWQMDVTELFAVDKQLLSQKDKVRILGKVLNPETNLFHACGVFTWTYDRNMTRKDLSASKKSFMQRMQDQQMQSYEQLEALESETYDAASADNTPSMRICAEIAMMKRISESMPQLLAQ